MQYAAMLKKAIKNKGLSLQQLCFQLAKHEVRIDKSVLSKMQNGKLPPAKDEHNIVLAKILDIDPIQFRLAAAREKIPNDLYELIKKTDKETVQMNVKIGLWNRYLVKVKRKWQLTKEIEQFYIRAQILTIVDRAQDKDCELVEELTDRLMTFLYEDETYKKAEIESEFWEWATDSPEHYLNHWIVNQVIEVKKGAG